MSATSLALKDLSNNELLALVAIARRLIELDGSISPGEAKTIAAWGEKVGIETLRRTLDRASAYLDGSEKMEQLSEMVTRPSARELVFTELFALATENAMVAAESELLNWLKSKWRLEIDSI